MAPKAKAAAAAPAPKAKAEPKAKGEPKKKAEKTEEEPRMTAPDREAHNEKLAAVNADIEKLNKEQGKLTEKINQRSGGKNEFFAQKNAIHEQISELSGKMNELQAQKDEINKVMGDKREEGREMRTQLNKMKKSIGYNTEREIDDRIASIEFKLWTESHALKDEKKLLQEIQELKRNRPKVSQVHKMEEGLVTFTEGLSMKDKVSKINEEMASYREQKKAVSAKLTELMEGRKEQLGDLPEIMNERTELGKRIQEKIKERNQLRDDFRAEEQAYYAWQAEQRKLRQERQQEEHKKWQAEQDQVRKLKKAEKLDEQPYVAEITLIEQTISFCKSFTQTKKEEKEEPSSHALPGEAPQVPFSSSKMAEVAAAEVPQAEKEELFCAYATMILKDSDLEISEDNLNTLIKAAGGSVDSFFTSLFAKIVKGKDLDGMLTFGGGGGGGPAVAGAGAGAAAPAAGAVAEKKEEKVEEEEEEEDMDFDLFG